MSGLEDEGRTIDVALPPERLGRQDVILASLFKTVFRLERDREVCSGMTYRPTWERVQTSFRDLMNFEGADSFDVDLDGIQAALKEMFTQIEGFRESKLRVSNETSYPQAPIEEMRGDELVHFVPPHEGSPTPRAAVYLEGGRLNYQLGSTEEAFDLGTKDPQIKKGKIGGLDSLPPEAMIDKLGVLLKSDQFRSHWGDLQGELSKSPKTDLFTVEKIPDNT